MKYYPLIPLFCTFFVLFIAGKVYYENKRNIVNQIFTIFCIAVSFISFAEFMVEQAENLDTARFWLILSSFWLFAVSILLHFSLAYTNSKLLKHKITYIIIYVPTLILSLIILYFNDNVLLVKEAWGYSTFIGNNDKNYVSVVTYLSIWASIQGYASLLIILIYYFRSKDKRSRLQTKYIAIAFLFPNIVPLIYILAQALNIRLPSIVPLPVTLMAVIIGYSIHRYKLFVFNTAVAAENIVTTMRDALFLVSSEGIIQKINPAAKDMLLCEEEEIIGKTIMSLFNKEEVRIFDRGLNEIIDKGGVNNSENNIIIKDGMEIPVLFSCSVLKDKFLNILGLVCIVKDISELKKLQEELIKSEKMAVIGRLSAEFAHDIRNSLNIIVGISEMLNYKKNLSASKLNEYSNMINKQVDKINNLIKNLLSFVREEDLIIEKVDIVSFLQRFITEQKKYGILNNEKITFNMEINEDKIEIDMDRLKMTQVFENLLINSVEAINETSREGGIIKIRLEKNEKNLQIYFYDNGCGMEIKNRDKIFEPFRSTKTGGTGFGLAIINKIIKNHEGRVEVNSEINKFTEFMITLPLIIS